MLRQGKVEIVQLLIRYRAFASPGLDLVVQDIAGPAQAGCNLKIPEAGAGFGYLVKNQQVVAPWDFCNKLLQKLREFFAAPIRTILDEFIV